MNDFTPLLPDRVCPKCGSMKVCISCSTTTLLHVTLQYDERGRAILPEKMNKTIDSCYCIECNNNFTIER